MKKTSIATLMSIQTPFFPAFYLLKTKKISPLTQKKIRKAEHPVSVKTF
jgi:hypothetical protein